VEPASLLTQINASDLPGVNPELLHCESVTDRFGWSRENLVAQSFLVLYRSAEEYERLGARMVPILNATGHQGDREDAAYLAQTVKIHWARLMRKYRASTAFAPPSLCAYRIGTVLRCALSTITNSRNTNFCVVLALRCA